MITSINHITLAVRDIERSFDFYKNVLGFQPLVKWNKGAYFLAGSHKDGFWFCLNVDDSRRPSPCYTHYAFSVPEQDFEKFSRRIIASGAEIFKNNTSPRESLYFLDPDYHKLEIHCGSYQSRMDTKKANIGTWENVEWFV